MKLTLTERIEKTSDKPYDKILSALESGIADEIRFFPKEIMNGEIWNGEIMTVINPPFGLVDPFKSRVRGLVIEENGLTVIKLKVSPSWVIIGFIVIWCSLTILGTITYEYSDLIQTLQFLGVAIIWTFIPLGIGKLKVNRDRQRLEKWISKQIKTLPNKS